MDIVHHGDLPAQSGLGSSSTFTVGLLHALYALKHEMPTKRELAINAIHIEQQLIGERVGSQDQTAAAFGGVNLIEFGGPHEVLVRPLIIDPERLQQLERHVMLFFTGFSRTASEVVTEQLERMGSRTDAMRRMMDVVGEAVAILQDKRDRMDEFGRLLHEQWQTKQQLSDRISNDHIDAIYQAGLKAGALGGKLLGAGGGGFMMFFVRPEEQARVKEALKHLLHVPCRFDHLGSQIIYFSHDDQY